MCNNQNEFAIYRVEQRNFIYIYAWELDQKYADVFQDSHYKTSPLFTALYNIYKI